MEMGSDCRPGKEVGDTRMIGWRVGNIIAWVPLP
jgi:hypothetical protein